MLLATSALAGCGGGDDDDEEPVAPPTQPPVTSPGEASVDKVLFVGVDGLTYDALRRGMADKTLPNIGQLTATRAWTGGVTGTVTQQPTLAAPGWATLLTGQWADVHGVRSNAQGQAIPGLYAAGRTAIGIASNRYVSGLSLADCLWSGRRAGSTAAQNS